MGRCPSVKCSQVNFDSENTIGNGVKHHDDSVDLALDDVDVRDTFPPFPYSFLLFCRSSGDSDD